MTRVLVVIAFLIAAGFLIYRQAGHNHRETTLERKNEIDNAITACSELPWFERLQCDE